MNLLEDELKKAAIQQIKHWGLWGEPIEVMAFDAWERHIHNHSLVFKDVPTDKLRAAWDAAMNEMKIIK